MKFMHLLRSVFRVSRNLLLKLRLSRYDMDTIAPYFRECGVEIGEGTRIVSKDVHFTFGSEPYLIRIGKRCSMAAGVRFITHDGGVWTIRKDVPEIDVFAPIEIKDNSIIGMNTIILPGVTIGPNSVVGAGSVVSKDIPPNTVAAGVPCRPLMSLEDYRKKKLAQMMSVRHLGEKERREVLMKLWDDWDKEPVSNDSTSS